MNINQLAFVLNHIDTSLHDTGLLAAYKQLIAALIAVKSGESAEMATIQTGRAELIDLLEQTEPLGWTAAQVAAFEMYEAGDVLGDSAVDRVNQAFVENFMNPAGLLAAMEQLHEESVALAEKVIVLLKGLDPVLESGGTLDGEIVDWSDDSAEHYPTSRPTVGAMLRSRFNLPTRNNSTAIVPANHIPLSTKIAAAAPVVLAAAGKAIELYRTYHEAKNSLIKAQPTKVEPVAIQPQQPQVTNYVRYTYRRSIYVVNRND